MILIFDFITKIGATVADLKNHRKMLENCSLLFAYVSLCTLRETVKVLDKINR